MGMIDIQTEADYAQSLRQLFPRGDFWDRQFSDPESDLSRWCAAHAAELRRFKLRRADLLNEGFKGTTSELIENWERVLGITPVSDDLDQRRAALTAIGTGSINEGVMAAIASAYGAILIGFDFPLWPTFFRTTHFRSRFAGPAVFSIIRIRLAVQDGINTEVLENALEAALLANLSILFEYEVA